MEGKLRIVSGNLSTKLNSDGGTPILKPKHIRASSAMHGANKVLKKIDLSKSPSPLKGGVKKLNVNVNVNVNGNSNDLPRIGSGLRSNLSQVTNITNITSTTPTNKLNSSILNTTVEKSPNRILPSKLKIISGPKPSQTQGERDKEAILDENQRLKVSMQRLKNEVAYHRAEYLKIESELKEKQKLIEDLLEINRKDSVNSGAGFSMNMNFSSSPNTTHSGNKVKEYNLIINLKKNLKEYQAQNKLKEEELTKLKKQIKLTKVNELLLENKTLNEEIKKIKDLYDTNFINYSQSDNFSKELQLLQSTLTRQQNLVESLQNHNNKLMDESKKQSEKIYQYKEKCNKLREELKDRNSEIDSLKKNLDEYEKLDKQSKFDELNKLIHQREEKLQKKKEKSQILKNELKEKTSHLDQLKKQCEEIPKMISTIEEAKIKISKKKERSAKLKQELKIKHEELNKIINEFNEMHRVSVDINKDNEQSKEFILSYLQSRVTELTKESSYYKILSQKRERLIHELKNTFPNLPQSDLQNYLKDQDRVVELQTRLEVFNLQIEERDKEIQQLKQKISQMESIIDVNVNIGSSQELNQNGGDDVLGFEFSGHMTEEQFSEMTYILIKNFEANNIDIKIAQEQIFNDDIFGDSANLTEKISDKIMEVLKNNNQANKEELIRYLKYFFMHYGTNYETIREQFISVFENISVYSKEACELMDQNLKSLISPYRFEMNIQLKKRDPDSSGYITFFNLRKILEHLLIQLDTDSVEYFIYKLKCFEDPQSSFRDLKYQYIFELLNGDGNVDIDDFRRASKTSSVVILPDKEYKAKSEAILAKIAAFLFSYEKSIKSVFGQIFTIQEKEFKYNAMYLKLFLNVLQEEMKIPLDYMDSLCMFNRLKNSNNIYNIEVIDIDKLTEEMVYFGICETDKDENQRKQHEAAEKEYEFDYETEDLTKAQANKYIHTEERQAVIEQQAKINHDKLIDDKFEEIRISNNVIAAHRINIIEKDELDNKNDQDILQRQMDKVTKNSKKCSVHNSPKKDILEKPHIEKKIQEMNFNNFSETEIKSKNSNIIKQKVVDEKMGYTSNRSQQSQNYATTPIKIENGDISFKNKRTLFEKNVNGVNLDQPSIQHQVVQYSEEILIDENLISLLIKIKSYLRFNSIEFDKVFINSDLHLIKKREELFVRLLPLLHFLNYKGIVSSWEYYPTTMNLINIMDSQGLINIYKLKREVENINFNEEQELEFSKKFSKIIIDDLFVNATNLYINESIRKEQELAEMKVISKEQAKNYTMDIFSGVLTKLNNYESSRKISIINESFSNENLNGGADDSEAANDRILNGSD